MGASAGMQKDRRFVSREARQGGAIPGRKFERCLGSRRACPPLRLLCTGAESLHFSDDRRGGRRACAATPSIPSARSCSDDLGQRGCGGFRPPTAGKKSLRHQRDDDRGNRDRSTPHELCILR
jgi:hypothetical protein